MLLLYDKYICFESDSIYFRCWSEMIKQANDAMNCLYLLLIKWLKIYHGYENHFCKVWKSVKVTTMWMIVWCVNTSYSWVNFMAETSALYGDLVKLSTFTVHA